MDQNEVERELAIAIVSFLEKKSRASQVSEEQAESLIVARQCIEAAFELPETITDQLSFTAGDNLLRTFEASLSEANHPIDKEKAIQCKEEGNECMRNHQYTEAYQRYSRAIFFDRTDPVYYCNRAASSLNLGNADNCISDCKKALSLDPDYGKAHGRMGAAYLYLKNRSLAIHSLEKALQYDPGNINAVENLRRARCLVENQETTGQTESATTHQASESSDDSSHSMPDASDMTNLLRNPQLINMASQMMDNPQIQQMISGMLNNMTVDPTPLTSSQSTGGGVAAGSTASSTTSSSQASAGSPNNLQDLLRAGQRMANFLSSANPGLIENLRQTFASGNNPNNPPSPSQPGGNEPS